MNAPKFFILLFLLSSTPLCFAEEVVVIVNAENPILQISDDSLQDYYFKRNRTWSDGKPVRFFDRQDSSLRDLFFKKWIKKTSRQVDQYWIGQKFNTGDSAPTQVSSDSLVIGLVTKFHGGIGFVSEGTSLPKEVKSIEIVVK